MPSPITYNMTDHFVGGYDIGDMYHDMSFDEVHFNVMGFTPQQIDPRSLVHAHTEPTNLESGSGVTHTLTRPAWKPGGPPLLRRQKKIRSSIVLGRELQVGDGDIFDQSTHDAAELLIATSRSQDIRTTFPTPRAEVESSPLTTNSDLTEHFVANSTIENPVLSPLSITTEKRTEIVEFLAQIRPIRPDGTLIDGNSNEISLSNLQSYLDLFFQYFNTSYPLIHIPTFDINTTDVGALSSFILLGATYRDKESHQLSVCLYNAIVPHIINTLLCNSVSDLAILQALLVLECYGMYRAGPYQRERAIFIHGMLLNVSNE
jgi:hypothetical protein